MVFIVTAFFSSRFTGLSALYALFILSFPVTKEGYVFATHGLLRYACAWPAAYGGMAENFAGRLALAVLAVLMAGMAVIIASLLAQKIFIF
ncbi:MAG: hypothetical protein PWQ18_261 [Clostridia bacterium]|nr:hypothetical protein [Clostridia bacterium]